jgi:hypothetical protein
VKPVRLASVRLVATIFVALLTSCAAMHSYDDPTGRTYLNDTFPAVMREWNVGVLDAQVVPEFYRSTPRVQTIAVMATGSRRFGELRSFSLHRINEVANLTLGEGPSLTQTYVVSAKFDRGLAKVTIDITKHNGQWKIAHIYIEPKKTT